MVDFAPGFIDFTPHYTGNPKRQKVVKAEHFVHLTRRAEQWLQTPAASDKQLLNVQTLDHNMYFKCVRDAIGEHPQGHMSQTSARTLQASPYVVSVHLQVLTTLVL